MVAVVIVLSDGTDERLLLVAYAVIVVLAEFGCLVLDDDLCLAFIL